VTCAKVPQTNDVGDRWTVGQVASHTPVRTDVSSESPKQTFLCLLVETTAPFDILHPLFHLSLPLCPPRVPETLLITCQN